MLAGGMVRTGISRALLQVPASLAVGWSLVSSRTVRDSYLPLLRLLRATVPPASFSLLGCTAPSGYVFHKVQFRVEEERSDTDQDLQD